MGFASDITNRIDGKKYLISTAEDKKGGWQTAVLKYRLFGIPDLLHPAMFIGAHRTRSTPAKFMPASKRSLLSFR
jgi:hypothetical protein